MPTLRRSIPVTAPQFRVKRGSASKYKGQQVREIAVATFDPSANTGDRTIGAHNLGVYIPNKAVIINAFYDVVTTFTSATDAATIKLGLVTQNDAAFVAAIAISDATNVWDAGLRGTLTAGTTTLTEAAPNTRTQIVHAKDIAAGYIKATAERELVATVAVEALTAGKLNLYVEYVISD